MLSQKTAAILTRMAADDNLRISIVNLRLNHDLAEQPFTRKKLFTNFIGVKTGNSKAADLPTYSGAT